MAAACFFDLPVFTEQAYKHLNTRVPLKQHARKVCS